MTDERSVDCDSGQVPVALDFTRRLRAGPGAAIPSGALSRQRLSWSAALPWGVSRMGYRPREDARFSVGQRVRAIDGSPEGPKPGGAERIRGVPRGPLGG